MRFYLPPALRFGNCANGKMTWRLILFCKILFIISLSSSLRRKLYSLPWAMARHLVSEISEFDTVLLGSRHYQLRLIIHILWGIIRLLIIVISTQLLYSCTTYIQFVCVIHLRFRIFLKILHIIHIMCVICKMYYLCII